MVLRKYDKNTFITIIIIILIWYYTHFRNIHMFKQYKILFCKGSYLEGVAS